MCAVTPPLCDNLAEKVIPNFGCYRITFGNGGCHAVLQKTENDCYFVKGEHWKVGTGLCAVLPSTRFGHERVSNPLANGILLRKFISKILMALKEGSAARKHLFTLSLALLCINRYVLLVSSHYVPL